MPKKSNNIPAATKADLKKLATKEDLNKFATKIELRGLQETLLKNQKGIEKKLDKIAITLDGFVGRVDDLTTDNVVGANQVRELDVKVEGHEKRISKLESSRINPQ